MSMMSRINMNPKKGSVMDVSIFLAKLLGVYFLIIAFLWAFRREQFQALIKEIIGSRALLTFAGFISLLFGLALVIVHNHWEFDYRLIITLIGYLAVMKGILLISFPHQVQKLNENVIQNWYWYGIIYPLIGAYLTYEGFFKR
jgi:uncharacterized membrane protein